MNYASRTLNFTIAENVLNLFMNCWVFPQLFQFKKSHWFQLIASTLACAKVATRPLYNIHLFRIPMKRFTLRQMSCSYTVT